MMSKHPGGRPVSKDRTQKTYQIDRGLAAYIDNLPNGSRSDFLASLIERGLQGNLEEGLEAFIASPDFQEAVESATIASWKGDEVRVEILPDGSWRKIYYSHGEFAQMKYDFPGAILVIPPMDCAEMPQFIEDGGTQQEWFTLAFANDRDEIEKRLRQELVR